MVHIEKVEIYGFKSFGFRNTTVKLVPGLVSISGPNGSGKSNILDAIAFALGEKSPTVLRVDSLKAVINEMKGSQAGTRVARVSVHLDNRDRSIPVDDDRVEITRVMGETGESAYYVNKKKGTRGRIQDVLEVANAGLGRLNNVQQGTVTRISEFSAAEKRGAIEDLVGLSYFDEKKDLASRQLEQADGRLEVALAKMDDVRTRIIEMEEERNHMVRQSVLERDIERYETIRRLRELAVLRHRTGDLESKMEVSDAEMEKNAAELEAIRREMESVDAKKQDMLAESSTHDAERTRIEREINQTHTKLQGAESKLRAAEGRVSRAEARLDEIRADLADIAASRAKNRRGAADLRARLEEAQVQAGRVAEALGSINERRRGVLERQAEDAARRARSDDTLRLLRNTLAGHERRLMEVDTRMKSAARQASSDRLRLGELEAGLAESDVNERRMASWLDRHTARADSVDRKITRLRDERTRLSSEVDEMDDLIRRAGQAAARYDSKLRLVRKVMHEDYSIGRLRNDAPGLGVLGLAYELLSWPDGVDRAAMAAGSDWLKALVVEDMEAMAAISEVAVSMGLPRLRIIPLHSIPAARPATGRLSEHISCSSGFEPLREFIFGGTVLAESEESARRHAAAGLRAVTRSGLCVEPGKAATLDLGSRISNLTKIISMSAEIGGLQNSVSLLERMHAHRSTRLRDADEEMRLESETLAELRADLATATQTLANAESGSAVTRRTLGLLRARLAAYDSDLPQMERRRHTLDSLVRRIRSLISSEEARMPTDSDQMASSLKSLNMQKAEFENLQTQTNTELSRMRAEQSGAVSAGERLLRRASKLASEQLTAMAERRDALSSAPLLRDAIGAADGNLKALRQTQQQMLETSRQSSSRLRSCESALDGLRKRERTLAGEGAQMQRRRDSLERDMADCRAAVSRIAESLPTRPDPGLPLDTDPAPFIAALRDEMESLPPLNANAPATYARVTSEYRSMSERKNSLEQERNRIVAFIEEVERDKRQTYLDAFDTVDKEIRSIFDRMSGGSAWLELEDEDDVFGSGIRYMVQFPGKSKRTSTSISGGEKTLAAVVFVLALQKLKPSPFYLFDEVDAHLDAPNSERLARILEERARDNQFIMVSLKESVVQKAGLIYGVYPKKGLSQVVSYRDRRLRQAAR